MIKYSIYQAKPDFSKLLQQVADGEEVIICNRDTPVAKIVPLKRKNRMAEIFGAFKGKIHIGPDFDALPEGFEDYT